MAGADLVGPSDPPSLDGLEEDEAVEAMVDWFAANYEDPAQSTPYDSSEGGYQYIWGGPYDAEEEIWGAFPMLTKNGSPEPLTKCRMTELSIGHQIQDASKK